MNRARKESRDMSKRRNPNSLQGEWATETGGWVAVSEMQLLKLTQWLGGVREKGMLQVMCACAGSH